MSTDTDTQEALTSVLELDLNNNGDRTPTTVRMKQKIATQIDPKKIKYWAGRKEKENYQFRDCLKANPPHNLDETISALSRKYFKLIDCRECGNCCRAYTIPICKSEMKALAIAKGIPSTAFQAKYTTYTAIDDVIANDGQNFWDGDDHEYMFKMGFPKSCPMLAGNLCSVYANRPQVCQEYPHLEKPDRINHLNMIIDNTFVCPIVFNVFEELKSVLDWR
jgi:Fe-S-cluster containining protein